MEYVLKTNALTKTYKNQKALDGLSMNVPKGAIYGFVGKNGAGKTTLIRLICGLQEPTSGEYTLYGQKKVKYKDGEAWPYYINDGIMIGMTNTETNDYGKYFRIYIVLTNNSFYPIEFDPSESIAILTDKKGVDKNLEIQTAQQYDKRIRRTQMWEEALVGFANGLAASQAGYSTSTTTSSYNGNSYSSGRASAYGSGGYAYGSYSGYSSYYGSSTSTTRTYDAGAAYQAQLAASQQMAAFSESNFQVRKNRNEGYLKRTTINPGESISGYFNIKRKKGETLDVVLNIAGAEYHFPWNVNRK